MNQMQVVKIIKKPFPERLGKGWKSARMPGQNAHAYLDVMNYVFSCFDGVNELSLRSLVCAKRFITISTNLYCSDPRPVFKEFGADTEAKVCYVRMHAYIPECESGWLFTDEIIIR